MKKKANRAIFIKYLRGTVKRQTRRPYIEKNDEMVYIIGMIRHDDRQEHENDYPKCRSIGTEA